MVRRGRWGLMREAKTLDRTGQGRNEDNKPQDDKVESGKSNSPSPHVHHVERSLASICFSKEKS